VTSLPIAAVALALSGRDEQTLGAATDLLFGRLRPLLRQVVPVDVLSLQTKTGTNEETVFSVSKWLLSNLFVAYQGASPARRMSGRTPTRASSNGTSRAGSASI
jgi:hypothetical protein